LPAITLNNKVMPMSARKTKSILPIREPSGRLSRSAPGVTKACSPAEVRRLRDAALAGMQASAWGTELGRLFLTGKIGAEAFEAGKWWSEMAAKYVEAIAAPAPDPRSIEPVQRGHSHPVDPDSALGREQAERDARTVAAMREAAALLAGAGTLVEATVRAVCERDEAPVGERGMRALDRGLVLLAAHIGLTNRRRDGRRRG
jgi:hypothetical protein